MRSQLSTPKDTVPKSERVSHVVLRKAVMEKPSDDTLSRTRVAAAGHLCVHEHTFAAFLEVMRITQSSMPQLKICVWKKFSVIVQKVRVWNSRKKLIRVKTEVCTHNSYNLEQDN